MRSAVSLSGLTAWFRRSVYAEREQLRLARRRWAGAGARAGVRVASASFGRLYPSVSAFSVRRGGVAAAPPLGRRWGGVPARTSLGLLRSVRPPGVGVQCTPGGSGSSHRVGAGAAGALGVSCGLSTSVSPLGVGVQCTPRGSDGCTAGGQALGRAVGCAPRPPSVGLYRIDPRRSREQHRGECPACSAHSRASQCFS